MKTLLMTFLFCSQILTFEVANTRENREKGLMYRDYWSYTGMLFAYDKPQYMRFWMKNTKLEMLLLYLDENFNLLEIHEGVPFSKKILSSKSNNVQYVLEIPPSFYKDIQKDEDLFFAKLQESYIELIEDQAKLEDQKKLDLENQQ